jgi:hypothetical protein
MKFLRFRDLCRKSAFVNIRVGDESVMVTFSTNYSRPTEACFSKPGDDESFDYMILKRDLEKAVIEKNYLKVPVLVSRWESPPPTGKKVKRGERTYTLCEAQVHFYRLASINPAKFAARS